MAILSVDKDREQCIMRFVIITISDLLLALTNSAGATQDAIDVVNSYDGFLQGPRYQGRFDIPTLRNYRDLLPMEHPHHFLQPDYGDCELYDF